MGIIMVAGLPSGGTSAVAGVLYHLGVNMGRIRTDEETLQAAAQLKSRRKYRGYECQNLYRMLLRAKGPADIYPILATYTAKRLSRMGRHGFKNNLCTMVGSSDAAIEELPLEVLYIHRNLETAYESDIRYTGTDKQRAALRGLLHLGLHSLIQRIPAMLTVEYDSLIEEPFREVERIAETFALDPAPKQISAAADSIDRVGCNL